MRTARLLVAAVALVALLKCSQSIFTAPPGSSITLFVNPGRIPATGGVSVVTAIVIDGTGQPVPDGTVVQFFTSLGRIDPEGRTNDGVAKVNLTSDGRSGRAECSAISGGGSIPTQPSTQPSASASATATATATPTATATASATTAPPASGSGCTVDIGAATLSTVLPIADPRTITRTGPRFTTLIATAIDTDGNPVANLPVVFTLPLSNTDTFEETLESRSLPVFTDQNGQARDRVFTARPRDASAKTILVQVAAVTSSATSGATPVGINF